MLNNIFQSVLIRLPAGLRGQIARGAAGTFALRIAMIGLAFVSSIVLARMLGPSGYGTYAYVLAWLGLLIIPAKLGMGMIVSREAARLLDRSEWGLLNGLMQWSIKRVLVASISLSLLAVIPIVLFVPADIQPAFLVSLVFVPLAALTDLRQGAMRGLHHVFRGQLPEYCIQPVLFVAALVGASYLVQQDLSVTWIMVIRGLSIGIAFVLGFVFLAQTMPKEVSAAPPSYQKDRWTKSIWPFMVISCTHLINRRADILMLGALQGVEAVGLYTIASRGAELITFVLTAVNMSLGPKISACYARGDTERLQKMVVGSTRAIFAVSLPIALLLIFFGDWLLQVYGSGFLESGSALRILCIGQLVNASVGSVGVLLDMTGNEKDSAQAIALGAATNVALNALMIPRFGVEGAAIATASSIVIRNILLSIRVRRKLNISPTIFGKT